METFDSCLGTRSITRICCLPLGRSAEHSADPEEAVRGEWRAVIRQMSPTGDGCFHAAYPSIVVERAACATGEPRAHPVHLHRTTDEAAVAGNGNDYVVSVTGFITDAHVGLSVTGVTSESSGGVKSFGDRGILGPNEYSVQLNTNDNSTTSACVGHGSCTVYQQFIYASDYIKLGTAAVFMQYCTLDRGTSACPSGWIKDVADCFRNSVLEPVPDLSIADLNMDRLLTAPVAAGGISRSAS